MNLGALFIRRIALLISANSFVNQARRALHERLEEEASARLGARRGELQARTRDDSHLSNLAGAHTFLIWQVRERQTKLRDDEREQHRAEIIAMNRLLQIQVFGEFPRRILSANYVVDLGEFFGLGGFFG